MSRVNYFDMSVDNPERAMQFYKSVFGWRFEIWMIRAQREGR